MGGWIVLLAGFAPDNSQNPRIFFVCAHVSTSGSTPEMYSSKNTTMPLPEIEPELLFWAESALPTTSLQLRLHMCVRAHVCVCVYVWACVCVYTQRTNVCTQQFRHNFSSSESSRFVASAPAACVRVVWILIKFSITIIMTCTTASKWNLVTQTEPRK